MMQPKAAVVVLNWNGWKDTTELLATLKQATYEPLLVIVVDNASTDPSAATIKQWIVDNQVAYTFAAAGNRASDDDKALSQEWGNNKHFLLIESKTNLGFCAGNNLGMEWASHLGAQYILALNNDTLVTPDFLEPMIDLAESNPNIGLVGGIITYCESPDMIWWAGGHFDRFLTGKRLLDKTPIHNLPAQTSYETQWISGCMMLIPTAVYRRFGGYFEPYFIWSEEWDYSMMVSRAGYKLMVATKTRICHKIGHSLGVMKPLNYYYGTRNRLIFQRRYLPAYYWYPYFAYYLVNRTARFTQLILQGRSDLVRAGVAAIGDFLLGKSGKWQRQKN